MTRNPNWGGVRPGAGPKRSLKPPLKKTAVTLEQWQVDWLRELGDGSVSAGVRRLIAIQLDRIHRYDHPEEERRPQAR